MKTHERNGAYYREVADDETIQRGDLISYTPAPEDPDWDEAISTVGQTPAEANEERSRLDYNGQCVWLRQIDYLVYEMLNAKEKAHEEDP